MANRLRVVKLAALDLARRVAVILIGLAAAALLILGLNWLMTHHPEGFVLACKIVSGACGFLVLLVVTFGGVSGVIDWWQDIEWKADVEERQAEDAGR